MNITNKKKNEGKIGICIQAQFFFFVKFKN